MVTEWIGNSPAIAAKHYLKVTYAHFDKATEGEDRVAQGVETKVPETVDPDGNEPQPVRTATPENTEECVFDGACHEAIVGPAGLEPATKGLCVPTTAFAAPFEFVVWTVSSLYVFAVQSLHLPLARLGSGLAYRCDLAFPEFDEFYQSPHL